MARSSIDRMPPRASQAHAKSVGEGNGSPVIPLLGIVPAAPVHVSSEAFEGSLATLFALVRDRRLDLLTVPLLPICEAYFEYLIGTAGNSEPGYLDEAAVALSALAYLLERKAFLLLPAIEPEPEEYEEPAELPPASVAEFRLAIEVLEQWRSDREAVFFRSADAGPDPYELPYELSNVSSADLALAFDRIISRARTQPMPTLSRPRRSLADQMNVVLAEIGDEYVALETLMADRFTVLECVYWFLAILELVRLGRLRLKMVEDVIHVGKPTVPQAKLWVEEIVA